MSILLKHIRELISVIRDQNSIQRELTAELRVFNGTVVPRLSKIEVIQEAKKHQKQTEDQIGMELDKYLNSDDL